MPAFIDAEHSTGGAGFRKLNGTGSGGSNQGIRRTAAPFAGTQSLDLDSYVTAKSLDGLFYMVGQEEKKIRTDPAARVTDLLKETFQN